MRLEGKIALVTGGGRGIGRAIALRFAREGADVVVHYGHSAGEAEETRAAIVRLGRRAHVVEAALGAADDSRRIVDEAARALGPLDVLVSNAGMEVRADVLEVTEKDWDQVLDVNLKAAFFVAQAFARHVTSAGRRGAIIQVSSVHEDLAFPGYAPYCASKGGMRMLTRDLAVELGPRGVTVNGIAPGAIETDINKELKDDAGKTAALLRKIPLGRLGTPDDVAGVAAFLASDDARYVTGATYTVDGGLGVFYEE